MACLFGTYLSSHAEVVLAGSWQEQIETLNRSGLTVLKEGEKERRYVLKATSDWKKLSHADLVLILVKSYQTQRAVCWAQDILSEDGLAVTLQNGLGNYEKLEEKVGNHRSALGITNHGATLLRPGVLMNGGEGPTYLACRPEIRERLDPVFALFNTSGIDTHFADNADSVVWGKLAVNAAINPITALLRIPNGSLTESPSTELLVRALASETERIARLKRISLPFPDAGQMALEVAKKTAINHSSMYRDREQKRPMEIDAICGAIVDEAVKLGTEAPLNRIMWKLIKTIEEIDYARC